MFYFGIDVSKAKLDCCLLDPVTRKNKTKSAPNTVKGAQELVTWLGKQGAAPGAVHVILEGTGAYHEAPAIALDDAGLMVSIVNPARVRQFANGIGVRTKNDRVDAAVLARYGEVNTPERWHAPPVEVRTLQSMLTRLEALKGELEREQLRLDSAQHTKAPALVLESLDTHIAFLQKLIRQLENDIDQHIDRHPDLRQDRQLLQSIPAVGKVVSRTMLATLHRYRFRSAEQLAAWMGLVPVERQSGSSVHGPARMSKVGPARLRAQIYMGALTAIASNPPIKLHYERLLARGKCKKAALGAAMRKLVHQCYGVVKNQRPFDAEFVLAG